MLDAETAIEAIGPIGTAVAALLEEGAELSVLAIRAEDQIGPRLLRMRASIDDAAVLLAAISILARRAGYAGITTHLSSP